MAKISINDEYIINGKFSIKRYIDDDNEIKVVGTLATHYYFEEITKIESYRYLISDIEVVEEVFGSDDMDIVYTFTAGSIENKHGLSNLSTEQIIKIEKGVYDQDGYLIDSLLSKGDNK